MQQTIIANALHLLPHVSQAVPEQLVMLQPTVVVVLVHALVASRVNYAQVDNVTVELVHMAPATQVLVHLA